MKILVINNQTEFVQVLTHGSRYSCPTKEKDGELLFRFKDKWYPVDKYKDENTRYLN